MYEAENTKAESFFEWAQAHPKFDLLFTTLLLALLSILCIQGYIAPVLFSGNDPLQCFASFHNDFFV